MNTAVRTNDWLDPLRERLTEVDSTREAIAREMAVLDARARGLAEEMTHIRALLELHDQDRAAAPRLAAEVGVAEPVPVVQLLRPSWKDAAREVLVKKGVPVHYRALHDELRRFGISFGGQNPSASFLAVLARDADFVRVGRGLYWLASEEAPAQGMDLATNGPVPRRRRVKVKRRA